MNALVSKSFAMMFACCLLALSGKADAQSPVPVQLASPHAPDAWDTRLADSVMAATRATFATMEMGDVDVRAWVGRIPGDPPVAGLYDDMDWPHELQSAYTIELDLGESLHATAEMIGKSFETRIGQDWTARALALAATAEGRPVIRHEYVLMPDDGMGSLGVAVHSPFVDLDRLEILEGTWVQIVRVSGEDF